MSALWVSIFAAVVHTYDLVLLSQERPLASSERVVEPLHTRTELFRVLLTSFGDDGRRVEVGAAAVEGFSHMAFEDLPGERVPEMTEVAVDIDNNSCVQVRSKLCIRASAVRQCCCCRGCPAYRDAGSRWTRLP